MEELERPTIVKDDQDKIIQRMILDTEFLNQCIRKKLEPDYFSGKDRKKMAQLIVEFGKRYKKAPFDSIPDIIEERKAKGRISSEDEELLIEYLQRIIAMNDSTASQFLLDRLDNFIKKRILIEARNKLLSLSGQEDLYLDKSFDIMAQAVVAAQQQTGRQAIELLSDDPMVEYDPKMVTKFNIEPFDKALGGGLRLGQFVVIQGYTNRGKSWIISHLAKFAARLRNSSLIVDNERPNKIVRLRLKMSMTGWLPKDIGQSPQEAFIQQTRSLVGNSEIVLVNEEEKQMAVDSLPAVLDEVEDKTGKKIKLVLLDSLDDMLPPSGDKYKDKMEGTTAKYVWMKNFCKDTDVCGVTTSQSQRRGETKWWLTSGTIGDDINKVRKATVGISINATDYELKGEMARLLVFKHSDYAVGGRVWINTAYGRGQLVKTYGKYNHQEYMEILKQKGIGREMLK